MSLPPNPGPDREAAILDLVKQGLHTVSFSPLISEYKGHTAVFQVFSDALKIEGTRVNVSARTAQQIADVLDCSLLTPKLADLMWAQRSVTLHPFPVPITATTAAMIEHSNKIDAALAKLGNSEGIIQTVGKHWVIDGALLIHAGKAMNYGWHFEGPSYAGIKGEISAAMLKDSKGQYVRVIQGRGTAHDMNHSDYSQTCTLVSRECLVNGVSRDIRDVLVDQELAQLASHQGVLHVLRQPGVEVESKEREFPDKA